MERLLQWLPANHRLAAAIGLATAGTATAFVLTCRFRARRRRVEAESKWEEVGRDVVVLHQFPR
jgi:hypothetical protein